MASKTTQSRLDVAKTYKMYVGGKFPRTESGRYFKVLDRKGATLANACRGSRKDLREAVVAARAAAASWQGISAYLRAQILYRIAEMLEGRSSQFVELRMALGDTRRRAERDVSLSVDRLVYYAGWCDKLTQVFGAINPVASSHYNFSSLEPTGVVGVLAPEQGGLLALVSVLAPVLAGGNTCVALASDIDPLTAVTFAEVVHASDVPAGVLNLLTGHADEILPHMAKHKDINALVHSLPAGAARKTLEREAAINIKRVARHAAANWARAELTPYRILDTLETKTTWHPVGL
ncbi:MAG: aldehyde dehydrogenase family protein [Gammaproteobacteria bacterium]